MPTRPPEVRPTWIACPGPRTMSPGSCPPIPRFVPRLPCPREWADRSIFVGVGGFRRALPGLLGAEPKTSSSLGGHGHSSTLSSAGGQGLRAEPLGVLALPPTLHAAERALRGLVIAADDERLHVGWGLKFGRATRLGVPRSRGVAEHPFSCRTPGRDHARCVDSLCHGGGESMAGLA